MSTKKAAGPGGSADPKSDEYWGRLRQLIRSQGDALSDVIFYLSENIGYERALEEAVRQNNRSSLLLMLEDEIPIPPLLLPALAEALRVASRGSSGGRRRKFTSSMEDTIRLEHWSRMTFGELTSDAAIQQLVDEFHQGFGVSKRTIERIVAKKWRADEIGAEIARELSKVPPQPPDDLS